MLPTDEPIPIYIGISERFRCVHGLTAKSILKNTDHPVKITHLYPEVEEGCTGFSKVRWTIKYGIYLDCDMIVLGDIADLWAYGEPGHCVCMRDGSTEVMVIAGRQRKNKIPLCWNVEDKVEADMKLLHFTALDWQPWFYPHPNKAAVAVYEQYKKI